MTEEIEALEEEYGKILNDFIEEERAKFRAGSGDDMFYEEQVMKYVNSQRGFWLAAIKKFLADRQSLEAKLTSAEEERGKLLMNKDNTIRALTAELNDYQEGQIKAIVDRKVKEALSSTLTADYVFNAFELGFKLCEKGMNFQQAQLQLRKAKLKPSEEQK